MNHTRIPMNSKKLLKAEIRRLRDQNDWLSKKEIEQSVEIERLKTQLSAACGEKVPSDPNNTYQALLRIGLVTTPEVPVTAADILKKAAGHMQDRAATYDAPQGERSMGKTVAMYNALYEAEMTEEQGWAFMAILKLVRSSQGAYRADNYEDGAAYMALMGESASRKST